MKNNIPQSPRIARWLLSRMLRRENTDILLGDFEEFYNEINTESGPIAAKAWYWKQVIKAIPHFIRNYFYWRTMMIENYLTVALRVIRKNKVYSIVNTMGLSVGMAGFILIFLWVRNELSFDKFHENSHDLYYVATLDEMNEDLKSSSSTPAALGPAIKEEYPEILNSARFINGPIGVVIDCNHKKLNELISAADQSVLEMFTFPLKEGSPKTALSDPYSIIISERMAIKYFDDKNPMGEVVTLDNKFDLRITGIMQNIPANSSLQFNFLVPIELFEEYWNLDLDHWDNLSYSTFVQLAPHTSLKSINDKIKDRIKRSRPQSSIKPFLVSFDTIRLKGLDFASGNLLQVLIFSIIAILILIIACINFMNITTARADFRANEIGVRFINGANKNEIRRQFFTESILISFISLLFSVIIVKLLLPLFNELSGKSLSFDFFQHPGFAVWLLMMALITGIIAGSYPAFYLSSFKPVKLTNGTSFSKSKGKHFRQLLVVFQFVISICLIIGSIVIYKQLEYMNKKDLGFNKSGLFYVPLNHEIYQHTDVVKNELLKNPNIDQVSLVSFSPTGVYSSDKGYKWADKPDNVDPLVTRFCSDEDFIKTFEVNMIAGEFYKPGPEKRSSDNSGEIIINETFASIIGRENPVGMTIFNEDNRFTVIGMVRDFNFKPLYGQIGPMALYYKTENSKKSPTRYRFIFIKIDETHLAETAAFIENTVKKYSPGFPFNFHFLEDDFTRLYDGERKEGLVLEYFTFLTIFISCLGLFGLATYSAQYRTKEIGIRKVFGSSVQGVVLLLTREFAFYVLISNIIAWPIAYFLSKMWLKNFAFQTNVNFSVFLLAALATVAIGLISVAYQSIKAATTNPVNALKYE